MAGKDLKSQPLLTDEELSEIQTLMWRGNNVRPGERAFLQVLIDISERLKQQNLLLINLTDITKLASATKPHTETHVAHDTPVTPVTPVISANTESSKPKIERAQLITK